ncbi:MAG: SDR family NAD(P)-dependent oxidoreductase [Novosphingobium sp.]|nr:SDR family NAD(P)-dependent oxidoreductase [Novosphingobium sp.]
MPDPMFDLTGRTCLITGASSGFGAHFARLLSGAGARLVLGARRKARLDALVAEIEARGGEALAVDMDVTDEASTIAAYDAAEAHFGTVVDTVIANAGVAASGRATEVSADALRQVIDTNLLGVLLTAREGAKRMIAANFRESGRGRILIIGSMGAEVPLPGDAVYSGSKAGVKHLGRSLAGEWVCQGINVNVLQPGYIQTEMAGDWFESEGGKRQMATFGRRRLQSITSLDAPVLYFCSDASLAATGTAFTIDDGQSL